MYETMEIKSHIKDVIYSIYYNKYVFSFTIYMLACNWRSTTNTGWDHRLHEPLGGLRAQRSAAAGL